MERTEATRERIKALNDEMRTEGPESAEANRWVLTSGVMALDVGAAAAIDHVKRFDAFDQDNDAHGEHDFGSFEIAGERLFWKVDYYNLTLDGGSPDPTDTSATIRVLTIMLALEY